MPVLDNPKHELFAQALAKGKTADEAYCAAGYRSNRGNACTLKANQSIADRVADILAKAAATVDFTLADAARQLDEDRKLAHDNAQAGAAVSASMAKAKLFGLVIERADIKQDLNVTAKSAPLSAVDALIEAATGIGAGGAGSDALPN